MSLRRRTLIIIGIVLLSLVLLMLLTSQTVLLNSFQQLEEREMRQNIQRAVSAIDDELAELSATTADYAYWDDSYDYIQNPTPEYVADNLISDAMMLVRVDMAVFVNADGAIVHQAAFGAYSLAPELEAFIAPGSPLVTDVSIGSGRGGLILTLNGPLLLAAHPITDSRRVESRGSLIFGRYLDSVRIDTLAAGLQLPVMVRQVNEPGLPGDFQTAQVVLSPENPLLVQPLGDRVAGYALLQDVQDMPILLLRVDSPRSIFEQGQFATGIFMLLLIIAGVVFGAAMLLLLERTVLSRLTQLSRSVQTIASSKSIQARLPISDDDELARLAQDINRMLDGLEAAQIQLRLSDDRLRAVVNSAPIMLWSVDEEGKITLLEGRSLDLFGIERAGSLGKPFSEVYRNVPQLVMDLQRAARGETFATLVPINEYTFDVSYTAAQAGSVIGVATDITERVLAEEALGQAYYTLDIQKRQMERVRELLRSTLEQINDTIKRGAPRDEMVEYLQFVQAQFNRMDQESAQVSSGLKR